MVMTVSDSNGNDDGDGSGDSVGDGEGICGDSGSSD